MSDQLSLIEGSGPPVLSIVEGRRRRDVGTARVLEHSGEWKDRVAEVIWEWVTEGPAGMSFTAEDIRAAALARGIPEPPNPNAWGGAIVAASRRGWVLQVDVAQAQRPEAHARLIRVWQGDARLRHPAGRGA